MKKTILILLLIIAPVLITGCSLADSFGVTTGKGGIYKSEDYGEKWQDANTLIKQDGGEGSLSGVNVSVIKQDPLDNRNLYLATQGNGIFYSHDSAQTWQSILPKGYVYDLVLDYQNSGVVFASVGNKVIKTIDLGKNWELIYTENREGVTLMALAINPHNNLEIYIGTSSGEIYKTNDGGEAWQMVLDTNDEVRQIDINPKNSRTVYVSCLRDGIFRTANAGKDWQALQKIYIEYLKNKDKNNRGVRTYRELAFSPRGNDTIIFASDYGLLKSSNGGINWQEIPTLLPPSNTQYRDEDKIKSLVINPKNSQQIYYGTERNLYRSFDGGQNWLVSDLPSSRMANSLVLDNKYDNILYMGLGQPIKP